MDTRIRYCAGNADKFSTCESGGYAKCVDTLGCGQSQPMAHKPRLDARWYYREPAISTCYRSVQLSSNEQSFRPGHPSLPRIIMDLSIRRKIGGILYSNVELQCDPKPYQSPIILACSQPPHTMEGLKSPFTQATLSQLGLLRSRSSSVYSPTQN